MKKREQPKTVAGVTLDLDDFDLLEPNPLELDKECCIQPRLVFAYLKEKAENDVRIDGLKAELKVAVAEFKRQIARLDRRIRRNSKKYKIDKLTETTVANTIILQSTYKDAESETWRLESLISKAYHYRNLLEAAAKALDNRKSSIESLVKLHGQSYFATPKTGGDTKERIASMKMRQSVKSRKAK